MTRLKKSAAAGTGLAILFAAFVGQWEGLRTKAYKDIVGIPTICYGETRGVSMGMIKTPEECKRMLIEGSDQYAGAVEKCIKVPLTDKQYVAFASLAYNVGPQAMCKSSAVKYFNAGDKTRACNALMNFIKAGGKVVQGLKNRREAERDLCLAD